MNEYRKPTPVRDEYILSPEDAGNVSADWHFSITPQQVDRLLAGYSLFHTENFGDCVLFSVDSENQKLAQCNLVALKRAANEACVQAMAQRDSIKATINWSNLYCAEARHYQSDDGSTGYEVTINEADPNNIEFHNFIYDRLVEFGFPGVEIRMEW